MQDRCGTQPQAHTDSYYVATVNDVTEFAPLLGEQNADVCIIGAGFTGISMAIHLAERGYDVHVVEANRVGWGASGRSGGQIIGGVSGEEAIAKHFGKDTDEIFRDLRWAGHDIIRDHIQKYAIECELKFGYLDVANKLRQIRALETDYERLRKIDFPHEVRMLSGDETCDTIGTSSYVGALLNMGNGHLHPLKLCVGEARAAVSLGARIYEQSPVLNIEQGKRPRVVTHQGSVAADFVVIAGNAYHALEKKLRSIMFPVDSFIIATEPLSEEMVKSVNPKDLAVCDQNYALQYFRLSADKRLLFGGRCYYFGNDPEIIVKKLRPKLLTVYPQLANIEIDYAWGGTIGIPVNRVPQLGKISPAVFYCQGYSGLGISFAHLAGRIMADAVAGTFEQFDLFANVKPVIVPGAYIFSTPLVALGMVYYDVKDRL